MVDSEPKDFKAVKVQFKGSSKTGDTLSRSMLYSGINIFGQLSQAYIQSKESGQDYHQFSETVLGRGKGESSDSGGGSMMNISQEVLAIFKRLQKKDSTTKIKAFQELERYVESLDTTTSALNQSMMSEDITSSQQQSDEIQNLLTFFLYHFCRIVMNEPDKKVREAAHTTLAMFIKKAKKRLGPHLKRIFSLWFCSFFDVSPEVASLAKRNFENAFPEGKRDQVFKIAFKNFLLFANEQLQQSEDQISESVADLSKAQREDIFDRITSSVLQALARSFDFTKDWNGDERTHFQRKLIDILDFSPPPSQQQMSQDDDAKKKKQPVHQSYLWSFLQSKYRGRVRAACLQFISSLLLNLPKDAIEGQIQQLAPLVHNLVGEDNSQLQATLWRDALFSLGKNFPNSWESTNIKKNFLQKLYSSLKGSGFGSPQALYENFVKFVSIFPFYHLIDYHEDKLNKASFKERCNLLRETLTFLYMGLKNDESVAFHQDLIKCYEETFAFILLKRLQPLLVSEKASQEDKDFAILQMKKCIQLPLEDFVSNYEKFNSKVQNQRNIRVTIPTQIAKLFRDLSERQADQRIFTALIDYMMESILLTPEKPNVVRVISALLKGAPNKDTSYFNENILQGFILKYTGIMAENVAADVENLGKENIEQAILKSQTILKTLYKLNKFEINLGGAVAPIQAKIRDSFTKVAKKEELASKVLTHEILVKFKALKENLLKSIVLSYNFSGADSSQSLPSFIKEILTSKSVDISLKTKVLMPETDFKKIKFNSFYKGINEQSSHALIIDFISSHIIIDEKLIPQNWQLIDSGLSKIGQKPSFILAEDSTQISIGVEKKLQSLRPTDYTGMQYYFSAIRSLLSKKDDSVYERLRELLFQKLLQIKATNQTFQPLWAIFSTVLKAQITPKDSQNNEYLVFCVNRLKENLTGIIQQKGQYSKRGGSVQFDAINRFTLICRSFVSLLPSPQHFIETILLDEQVFTSNLSQNCLPLKMFRDLFLAGGLKGGFDVSKLFTEENASRFVWLAGVLLNVRHLPSLANFVEMKKQLVIFVDTEVLPLIINQAQNGDTKIVIEIVQYMAKQGYVHSLEQFIHKMVDPGEDYPAEEKPVLKIEDFKKIFQIVELSSISEDADYSIEVRIFLRVLREISYYVLDCDSVNNLFKQSAQILQEFTANEKSLISGRVAIALEVYLSTSKFLGEDHDLRNKLLIKIMQTSSAVIDSFQLNAILDFVANNLESMGVSQFTATVKQDVNFQGFISWLFETQQEHHLQPLTYIHMLSIIRKTINAAELINDRPLVVEQVIDIAKDHALAFEIKVNRVETLLQQANQTIEDQQKNKHIVHFEQESSEDEEEEDKEEGDEELVEDFEYEMLQEVAETMIAMTNHVSSAIDENNLFILISSGVEALQKAAFVLLKQLYENYIPTIRYKIDDSEMLLQIKQEAKEQEIEDSEAKMEEEEKGGEKHHHHDHEKVKNKLAFRNISDILIEILENPPAINQDGQVHSQHVISGSTHIENLIFQEAHSAQNQLNPKVFGYLLAWNALLIKIENGRIKSQLQNHTEYSSVLGALNEYLEENDGIYRMLLVNLLAYLPEQKRGLQDAYNVNSFIPEYADLSEKKATPLLTIYTLLNFMKSFPSLARKYFQECDKQLQDLVMPYIKQIVSPAILENEIKKIEVAQLSLGQSELTFALFKSTKEILASFSKGEIEMTLKIKIPADYPLKLVEVDVSRQLKISEKQLRKWILAIRKIIQFQNGDIISAVLAWKANIEREIEGVEDCYICYCVVHENDQSLPKMPCKTCKNKFHVACIRKWFRQSHKSNCPICQNYFF